MQSVFMRLMSVTVLVLVFGLMWVAPASIDAADPVLSRVPSSGPIGTKVVVSICGMTPGNTVVAGNITFNGQPWNERDLPIDSAGCMCATELTVPVAPVGPNAVVVDDGNIRATGVFTVTQPNIVVSPTSGYKSQTLTVTGTGWLSTSRVTVTFQGSKIKIITPNTGGNFKIEFPVPLTAQASNIIGASDNIGNVGPAAIFILKGAGLAVSPSSGLPGTLVQLTGWGFESFCGVEDVRIANYYIPANGLLTSGMGTFSIDFEAPNLPVGGHTVGATVAGQTLDTCFTILGSDIWIPTDDDYPTPVEVALSTISHELIRVWGYYDGEWTMYDPLDPIGSTLPGLVSGRAYWVKVSADCGLIFRDLKAGWNNVGW